MFECMLALHHNFHSIRAIVAFSADVCRIKLKLINFLGSWGRRSFLPCIWPIENEKSGACVIVDVVAGFFSLSLLVIHQRHFLAFNAKMYVLSVLNGGKNGVFKFSANILHSIQFSNSWRSSCFIWFLVLKKFAFRSQVNYILIRSFNFWKCRQLHKHKSYVCSFVAVYDVSSFLCI